MADPINHVEARVSRRLKSDRAYTSPLRSSLHRGRSLNPEQALIAAIYADGMESEGLFSGDECPTDICSKCAIRHAVFNLRRIALHANSEARERLLCVGCLRQMKADRLAALQKSAGISLSGMKFLADKHAQAWNHAKASSKNGVVKYTLQFEHVIDMWRTQQGNCALSGQPMILRPDKASGGRCASIDRINSNLGYTKGNVQLVCWAVNDMKGTMGQEAFVSWCAAVATCAKKTLVTCPSDVIGIFPMLGKCA